jgi:hypothetical protein
MARNTYVNPFPTFRPVSSILSMMETWETPGGDLAWTKSGDLEPTFDATLIDPTWGTYCLTANTDGSISIVISPTNQKIKFVSQVDVINTSAGAVHYLLSNNDETEGIKISFYGNNYEILGLSGMCEVWNIGGDEEITADNYNSGESTSLDFRFDSTTGHYYLKVNDFFPQDNYYEPMIAIANFTKLKIVLESVSEDIFVNNIALSNW